MVVARKRRARLGGWIVGSNAGYPGTRIAPSRVTPPAMQPGPAPGAANPKWTLGGRSDDTFTFGSPTCGSCSECGSCLDGNHRRCAARRCADRVTSSSRISRVPRHSMAGTRRTSSLLTRPRCNRKPRPTRQANQQALPIASRSSNRWYSSRRKPQRLLTVPTSCLTTRLQHRATGTPCCTTITTAKCSPSRFPHRTAGYRLLRSGLCGGRTNGFLQQQPERFRQHRCGR